MNKSDKNKKRQSAITHENDKNQNKKLLNSNKTNENNISIDEMLKIHNEKVKKRKYSQYEKENISIDKNSNNADNSIQNNNKNTIDNKYSLSRPKKILAYSKRSLNVNNISKNLKTNQCSFVANTKNLCKNNDSNLNKNNTTSCNLINNSLLVSVKKNSNKTLNEDKTAMKTVHKKDINSFDTVKEKTNKKGPLRINRFDANLINLTNYNSSVNFNVKNLKRGFSTSNDNFKDNKSLKLKSIKVSNSVMSRNKSLTSTTVTYCPRLFSASVMKKVYNNIYKSNYSGKK